MRYSPLATAIHKEAQLTSRACINARILGVSCVDLRIRCIVGQLGHQVRLWQSSETFRYFTNIYKLSYIKNIKKIELQYCNTERYTKIIILTQRAKKKYIYIQVMSKQLSLSQVYSATESSQWRVRTVQLSIKQCAVHSHNS